VIALEQPVDKGRLRGNGIVFMDRAIRFVRWMDNRKTFPTWKEVADHFEFDRATAFRWIRAYKDAMGMP